MRASCPTNVSTTIAPLVADRSRSARSNARHDALCEQTTKTRPPEARSAAIAASIFVFPEPVAPPMLLMLADKDRFRIGRALAARGPIRAVTARRVDSDAEVGEPDVCEKVAAPDERCERRIERGGRTRRGAGFLRRAIRAVFDDIEGDDANVVVTISKGDERHPGDLVATRAAHEVVESELRFVAEPHGVEIGMRVVGHAAGLVVED